MLIGTNETDSLAKIWECPCSLEEEGRRAAGSSLKLHPQPTGFLRPAIDWRSASLRRRDDIVCAFQRIFPSLASTISQRLS